MQAGDDRSQPDLLLRFHFLLTGFSIFALRGDVAAQTLLEEACRAASDAWGGPACIWQYSSDTGWFHRRATARWPEGGERDCERQPEAEAAADLFGDFRPGERAGPVVHPAPWLRQQQFQHIARIPVRDQQAGFGYMDVGIPDASIGAGDAAFLEQLANLLGLALARVAERAQLRSALAAKDDQLREKDLMMQEVHHRVRNSLQLVHTLLTLQARSLRSPEAKHQLEEAASRIITIGSVHRRLYQGASVTETDMGGYLRRLLDDLVGFAGNAPDRRIEIVTPSLVLPAEKLTPLGLITAELVTNAMKYGKGAIRVVVEQAGRAIDITVEDEGPGFPAGFSPARASGLGMRIVSALSKAGKSAIRVDRTVSHGRITARLLLDDALPAEQAANTPAA